MNSENETVVIIGNSSGRELRDSGLAVTLPRLCHDASPVEPSKWDTAKSSTVLIHLVRT